MYEPLKRFTAWLLQAPTEPPEAPAGSEASTRVFRASPRYLTYRLLGLYLGLGTTLLGVGGMALVITLAPRAKDRAILLGMLALVALPILFSMAFSYFTTRLDYELRYYILTDRSLRIREGAWIVREITLTHANIQNVSISRGPLQRYLGIADLRIQTAGGGSMATQGGAHGNLGGHQAMLAGLEDVEAVRDQIQAYLNKTRDAGLGDDDDDEDATPSRGWSPAALNALREVAHEAQALRSAV